ncbi:MAG: hypothetical protein R3F11_07100 [Verrucomicrobiales bacterium]
MKSFPIRRICLVFVLIAAAAATASAVPIIQFQGRQTGVWNTILHNDTNPDQTVPGLDRPMRAARGPDLSHP